MTDSYTLNELTALARQKAKGARNVDARKVHCKILPCRICWKPSTHVHTLPRFRGTIMLEPSDLAMPKRLQEWLIGHEVSHLHTVRMHRANHFNHVQKQVIGEEYEQLWHEYWQYRREHQSELRGFARSLSASLRRAPELTTEQQLLKVNQHMAKLSIHIKRLTTRLKKWSRRKQFLERKLNQTLRLET